MQNILLPRINIYDFQIEFMSIKEQASIKTKYPLVEICNLAPKSNGFVIQSRKVSLFQVKPLNSPQLLKTVVGCFIFR